MDSNKSNNNSELNEVPREDTSAGNNISNDELMSSKKKRGNKNKIEHRKKQQKLREVVAIDFDSQLDSANSKSPLILIELSTTEWKRLMPNAIEITNSKVHLQPDTHINKRKIFYNNIKYGSNISKNPSNIQTKTLAMKDESPKYVSANILNLHEIKKSAIAIVTDKHEVSNIFKNFICISSTSTPGSEKDTNFRSSNKILLFFAKHDSLKSPENNCKWNSSILPMLKDTKPNICVQNGPNNHFRSQGYIAAWGNKAFYGKTETNSSVSQYVTKSPKKSATKEQVEENDEFLEKIVADEVELSVVRISKYFPNIRTLIAPILQVAYEKQMDNCDVNFNLSKTSKDGLWQSELCINAITREFHTERDITYTLISVPQQYNDESSKRNPSPTYFLFQLDNDNIIGFKTTENTSFIFNGTMLTHRQFNQDGYEKESVQETIANYHNIACYGNQRLFNHLRHSFRRALGLE